MAWVLERCKRRGQNERERRRPNEPPTSEGRPDASTRPRGRTVSLNATFLILSNCPIWNNFALWGQGSERSRSEVEPQRSLCPWRERSCCGRARRASRHARPGSEHHLEHGGTRTRESRNTEHATAEGCLVSDLCGRRDESERARRGGPSGIPEGEIMYVVHL